MREIALLILAAALEVGGDALIRGGLKGGGIALMLAGVIALSAYGFFVNLTKLNFSHLMGLYIVLFFAVSQVVAVTIFRERPSHGVWVGGCCILAGGVVMSVWR